MKRWNIEERPEADRVERFARQVGVSAVTAALLMERGISTPEQAESYLNPRLSQLHDPYLMRDMRKAVERRALLQEPLQEQGIRQVACDDAMPCARTQPTRRLQLVRPPRRQHDLGAEFRRRDRRRASDAGRCAGHENPLAVK